MSSSRGHPGSGSAAPCTLLKAWPRVFHLARRTGLRGTVGEVHSAETVTVRRVPLPQGTLPILGGSPQPSQASWSEGCILVLTARRHGRQTAAEGPPGRSSTLIALLPSKT